MIEIICKDNKFLVKGSINFGIAGVCENKIFDNKKIEIISDLDEIINYLKDENSIYYKMLKPYIENNKLDENTIVKGLECYYNKIIEEIEENIKQVNDYFLLVASDILIATKYAFWEIEEIIIKEEMKKYNEENLEREIYNEKINELYEIFEKQDTSRLSLKNLKDIDVEKIFRKTFPMFNLDKFLEYIVPEGVILDGDTINISFSDTLDDIGLCFCSAYFSFYEGLIPEYIDNF